jgi:hypothetical protein
MSGLVHVTVLSMAMRLSRGSVSGTALAWS